MNEVVAKEIDIPYNSYVEMIHDGRDGEVNALVTMNLVLAQNETNRLLAKLVNILILRETPTWLH